MQTLTVSILFIFILTSCATQRIDLDKTDFRTRITASGLKHFEVRIKRTVPKQTTVQDLDPQKRQRREARVKPKNLNKLLKTAADMHIEKNGFCNTGYWVMETNTYNPQISLRGECNESAEMEDRENYPNTIQEW